MNIKLWIFINTFIIGCVAIEVGIFLQRLDSSLVEKLANPHSHNSTQLFRDLAAYCFNVKRLFRWFKLKRETVMETAKSLHSVNHPAFIKNFSCEKVKEDFEMTDHQYKDLIHFVDQIITSLNDFYKECEANPEFVGVPIQRPESSLEKTTSLLTLMLKNPSSKFKKHQLFNAVDMYFYLLGKLTKKFKLGRRNVMERAKILFESGGPKQFLQYYDYFKVQKDYFLTGSEAFTLDTSMRRIQRRYEQFTAACSQNPKFESKIDFSSINIVRDTEQELQEILSKPSFLLTEKLFKSIRDLYNVFGFLRRQNIPNRTELFEALYEIFGTDWPTILKPLDLQKLKADFRLQDSKGDELEEYIGYLRRRFEALQKLYLNPNTTNPALFPHRTSS